MILFQNDWEHYPTAIADDKTQNTSFLEFSSLLIKLNVKNNLFPLQLLQPELSGLDPLAPDFPVELRELVAVELKFNPFYFWREIFRLPPQSGMVPDKLQANRACISYYWSLCNHIDYFQQQIRQTGKSVCADGWSEWPTYFGAENMEMLLITKDDQLRRINIARLQKMRTYFPKWLVLDDKSDANNQTTITYNSKRNVLRTAVGQNSEESALNIGRGSSVSSLLDDEGPFTPYIDITLPAALAAGGAARDSAARNNQPYANSFTTTPGRLDTRSGAYMYKLMTSGCLFDEKFYDCVDHDELVDTIKKNPISGESKQSRLMLVGDWNHLQLGKSDEWLLEKVSNSNASGEEADRDYFGRWTSGGIGNPLPVAILESIKNSEMEPVYTAISKNRYIIKWYVDETEVNRRMDESHIIVGVDTSDAIGADDIQLYFIDAYSMETLGCSCVNESNLIRVAQFVADMMVKSTNVTMNIEKKSSAQTFIDALIIELVSNGIDPLTRIYNRIVDDKVKHRRQLDELRQRTMRRMGDPEAYDPIRSYFGFNTSAGSRNLLYGNVLTKATERCKDAVKDKTLSNQIRKLVVKNGRLDHAAGGHDDAVFAWMLAHWLLMYGNNLDHYGIDVSRIQLRSSVNGNVVSQETLAKEEKQHRIMSKIDTLTDTLSDKVNPVMEARIVNQLRHLNSLLADIDFEPVGLDSLKAMAAEKRNKKRMNQRLLR